MAITPIRIIPGGSGADAIGQLLGTGVNVLQQSLNNAVTQGRAAADLQFRQEEQVLDERERIDKRNERKDLELRRRFESDRGFDEAVLQDRRDFAEGVRQFGVTSGLAQDKLGLQFRQFEEISLPQSEEALRGAAQARELANTRQPLQILESISNINRNLSSGNNRYNPGFEARLDSLFLSGDQPTTDAATSRQEALAAAYSDDLFGDQLSSRQEALASAYNEDLFEVDDEPVRGLDTQLNAILTGQSVLDPQALPFNQLLPTKSGNPLLESANPIPLDVDRLKALTSNELLRLINDEQSAAGIISRGGRAAYDELIKEFEAKRAEEAEARQRAAKAASRISVPSSGSGSPLNPTSGGSANKTTTGPILGFGT